MPKLIQNQCQNRYRRRSWKSWNFMFFWKGKTLILSAEHHTVVQKQASRGFVRGECANGKLIKKPSKMRSKSIPKSMQNRYKFHTRKRDAKNTENHPKWGSKGSQKPSKIPSKIYVEIWYEKRCKARLQRSFAGVPGGVQFKRLLRRVTYGNNLTREKNHIGKEQHHELNTPWAPSGPERI